MWLVDKTYLCAWREGAAIKRQPAACCQSQSHRLKTGAAWARLRQGVGVEMVNTVSEERDMPLEAGAHVCAYHERLAAQAAARVH